MTQYIIFAILLRGKGVIYTERNGRQLVGSRNRRILMADGTLRPYR